MAEAADCILATDLQTNRLCRLQDIFCKIRRRGVSSSFPCRFVLQATHPKRQSKKAYEPEFLYDFPPSSLFHEDFDLEEKGDTLQHVQSAKQCKPATVPAASPPPVSPEDSASFLTYDQQLQRIQLQKFKKKSLSWN